MLSVFKIFKICHSFISLAWGQRSISFVFNVINFKKPNFNFKTMDIIILRKSAKVGPHKSWPHLSSGREVRICRSASVVRKCRPQLSGRKCRSAFVKSANDATRNNCKGEIFNKEEKMRKEKFLILWPYDNIIWFKYVWFSFRIAHFYSYEIFKLQLDVLALSIIMN